VIPVVTVTQMRRADEAQIAVLDQHGHGQHGHAVLVERAGAAVAFAALRMLSGAYGKRVVVIAGKGSNGADGKVAARRLADRGAAVEVIAADVAADEVVDSQRADLVIDAAYGTGFRGTWEPPLVFGVPVLAVDVPSGLDADVGTCAGDVLRADRTITFAALKVGHLMNDGPQVCGDIEIADIGVDVVDHCDDVATYLVEPTDVAAWIPPRNRDAHKWSHAVRVIAGCGGMTGAAALVCAAAMRAGAGIVHVSMRDSSFESSNALPTEVVQRHLTSVHWGAQVAADAHRFAALVIGPGLGRGDDVSELVRDVVRSVSIPVVVDGDGLAAVVDAHGDSSSITTRTAPTVLTPHDGEFASLGGDVHAVDKISATRQLAERTGCVVLRKGPTTIVTSPDGPTFLVASGDQRLATAGSGDVLSGIIAAFLSRGMDAAPAATAAAVVQGVAASLCSTEGTIARDVVGEIAHVLAEMCGPQ